jgi:hypothetical protein
MIAAQEKFGDALHEGHQECNGYVNDMTSLRNSLSGDFKNLAFLQVRIGEVGLPEPVSQQRGINLMCVE